MLKGLENIEWWEDEKIPQYIKDLLSKDPVTVSDSFSKLSNNFLHQSTIYEDTYNAMPFLWEILEYHLEVKKVNKEWHDSDMLNWAEKKLNI